MDGPLGDIYAQVLVQQGRLDELLDHARGLLTSRRRQDHEVMAGIFSIAAALLEGHRLLSEGQTFWLQARRAASRGSDGAVKLACLIGSIRTLRKLNSALERRMEQIQRALSLVSDLTFEIYDQRVVAREAGAELSELLLPGNVYGNLNVNKGDIFRLINFVLQTNEAFPSAVENPERLRELGVKLAGPRQLTSMRELNAMVARSMYNSDDTFLLPIIRALRDEVDWTLARPWKIRNQIPDSAVPVTSG